MRERIYLSSPTQGGTIVPLTSVVKLTPSTMPLSVNHQGQLPAVTISFNLDKGYSLGDALTSINRVQAQLHLPGTGFAGRATAAFDRQRHRLPLPGRAAFLQRDVERRRPEGADAVAEREPERAFRSFG